MVRIGIQAALAGLLALPVAASAKGLKTLYQFTQPFGSLGEFTVDKSGLMYGTSTQGGSAGLGTVFSFNPKTKALTILYSFLGGSDGSKPVPGMVLSNGVLYGATAAGGPANDGTVFTFNIKAGTEAVLHSFSGADGQTPQYPPTLSAGGILYGTTSVGGKFGVGAAYQIKPHSGAEKVIFNFTGAAGIYPNALTIGPTGLLYGTCHSGGVNFGTLFALDPATGVDTVLYTFTESDYGQQPSYNVLIGQNGLIYGTGLADLFQFDPTTGVMTHVHAYDTGNNPTGDLVVDQSGNIYGSAAVASNDIGEIFQYNPTTLAVTVLWESKGFGHESEGFIPQGVVLGKSGQLYGTTPYNVIKGQPEDGTIFSLAP